MENGPKIFGLKRGVLPRKAPMYLPQTGLSMTLHLVVSGVSFVLAGMLKLVQKLGLIEK